jgi:hypothetical protein
MTRVLTGYLEPRTVRRIDQLAGGERDIDIGYRSWRPEAWLGRHGMLKGLIAERFVEEGRRRGLRLDISMDPADTLLGDAWYRFMLRCRSTIGVEGGASILDHDGRIRECVSAYTAEHPQAGFEEIERSCFPGRDGSFNLRAISPRHLEACATRTPQILIEGSYNGILEPWRHYVPLREDFSNISEALDEIADGARGALIAEQAYQDVVASGRYTYASFVAALLASLPAASRQGIAGSSLQARAILAWGGLADRLSWVPVWLRQSLRRTAIAAFRRLGLLEAVRAARRRRRLQRRRRA